jgi:hypothetical protein
MTYDFGNPGPGLGQTLKCGGVKSINVIPTHHVHIIFIVLNPQIHMKYFLAHQLVRMVKYFPLAEISNLSSESTYILKMLHGRTVPYTTRHKFCL